jgi:hypothetical protein
VEEANVKRDKVVKPKKSTCFCNGKKMATDVGKIQKVFAIFDNFSTVLQL